MAWIILVAFGVPIYIAIVQHKRNKAERNRKLQQIEQRLNQKQDND